MSYLNQKAQLERAASFDEHGDLVPQSAVMIQCRKEPYMTLLPTKNGTLYQTSNRYFLGPDTSVVAWQDKLDGLIVAKVAGMVNRAGRAVGFEVYT